jgi:cytolysin (calcineurin-like family phosphatase)
MPPLSRRQFLATTASAALLPAIARPAQVKAPETVGFFLVGDTHYLADKEAPTKLDPRSSGVNSRLVATLNKLPGSDIRTEAGGGKVLANMRGLIHAGDVIDTGDKNGAVQDKMQVREWAGFDETFGLTGKDAQLKMPVYEVHGNHDSPPGTGLSVKKIAERNTTRPGLASVSPNGVHYSWDWGGIHFINLGIVVGQVPSVKRKRRYNPLDSLDFLVNDLKEKIGTSNKPVVITHHVDMVRYAGPSDIDDKLAMGKEWDPADVNGYFAALKGFNIIGVFYGHTHVRDVFRWDGGAKKGKEGLAVFNVDNSGHYNSKTQGFFYVEIGAENLVVREYATDDMWETGAWTPQSWSVPVKRV